MDASKPSSPPHEPVRVVVVDDDRDGAATMAALLECEGYAVRTAHDGLHALPTIQQWHPSCVLLDIDLPGMDGYDIARRLRRSQPDHGMLLIATSGWTRPGSHRSPPSRAPSSSCCARGSRRSWCWPPSSRC